MIKQMIREVLIAFQIPATKNIHYDILTKKLMKKVLRERSNCIDIGGFKGEIMMEILKFSPHGRHFIVEPIPDFYQAIENKFADHTNVEVKNLA